MHATIYTKDHCPYCTRAKALLNKRGITYDEKIIATNGRDGRALTENQQWTTREALLEQFPDAKTVPQIWLDGEHIGGHDDLVRHLGA
jgi:glutaredoxin